MEVGKASSAATEQAQRKPQNVWKVNNPLTSKPSTPTAPNGVTPTVKPAASKPTTENKKESNTANQHANDRLNFLLANFVGLQCTVTVRNGERYTGIFSGGSLESSEDRYVLKMVKKLDSVNAQQTNGVTESQDEYVGQSQDHVMTFDTQDVVDLNCANVSTTQSRARAQNGTASSFRTDVDISGNLSLRERDLQRWEPSEDSNVDLSLGSGDAGGWDQFAENKRLYGVDSDYNEELYTTKIDRSNPRYAKLAADAERKAREIEGSSAMNAHVAEERGLKSTDDSGLDEEEKYSGVRREFAPLPTGNSNVYSPPARRSAADTNAAAVLNDPAILNASTAKVAQPPTNEEKVQTARPAEAKQDTARPPPETKSPASELQLKNVGAKEERKPAEAVKRNPENATETVERDLRDAFKQFANTEKALLKNHQRDRQNKDKQMKINELRKFAHNFKLNTPVPQDLVPILAKDERKQKEIMEKAKQAADEVKATPSKVTAPTSSLPDQKAQRAASSQVPPSPADRSTQQRRPPQDNRPPVSYSRGMSGSNVQRPGNLGQRLSNHRGGIPMHPPVPAPIQIPQGPGMHSGVQSPGSAASTRLHAGAREFKPNPAANTFSPNPNPSTSSSPRHDYTRPASKGFSDFWEGRNLPSKNDQRPSVSELFNAIPRLSKEAENDPARKKYESNGGIPYAYSTPPAWDVPEANLNIKYAEMFEKTAAPVAAGPPQHVMPSNGHIPHQHQLPLHLQQSGPVMHQGHTPHQTPRHMPAQPHPGQHFDDHQRMQVSHSQQGMQPSPQPNSRFVMPSGQNVPQMYPQMPFAINAQGQQIALRSMPAGMAPQFLAQHPGMVMGGQVMTQQASSGPYIQGNPQMGVYQQSPAPGHAFPHQGGMPNQMQAQGPPPGPNGYPSPRPPAPMMQQQGSQQGHVPNGPGQPMMYLQQGVPYYVGTPNGPMTPMRGQYVQPHHQAPYGSSPHQHYQHGPHRGTPGTTYSQPMMQQHHGMAPHGQPPAQQPSPAAPGMAEGAAGGEEVK